MSHSLRKVNLGNSALCSIMINNYAGDGGEQFTLAELGLTGSVVAVVVMGVDVFSNPNNYNVEYVGGGKIRVIVRPGLEAPATTAMNLFFTAMVQGT